MSLSGLAKFVIGFIIGVFLLVGAGAATGYYFLTKLTTPPPRPVFPEEQPKPKTTAKAKNSTTKKLTSTSLVKPSSTPSPTKLEPGAYKARVSWRDGLSLRAEPSIDANKVGGISYNQRVIVLKESDDKNWQQVRVEDGSQEGWVKAGNIERIDSQSDANQDQ